MGIIVRHIQDHDGGRKSYRRQVPSELRKFVGKTQIRVSLGRLDDPGFLSRYESAAALFDREIALARRKLEGAFDPLDAPTVAYLAELFRVEQLADDESARWDQQEREQVSAPQIIPQPLAAIARPPRNPMTVLLYPPTLSSAGNAPTRAELAAATYAPLEGTATSSEALATCAAIGMTAVGAKRLGDMAGDAGAIGKLQDRLAAEQQAHATWQEVQRKAGGYSSDAADTLYGNAGLNGLGGPLSWRGRVMQAAGNMLAKVEPEYGKAAREHVAQVLTTQSPDKVASDMAQIAQQSRMDAAAAERLYSRMNRTSGALSYQAVGNSGDESGMYAPIDQP